MMALLPSTLLHQSHDHRAARLFLLGFVVLLVQLQSVLGVGPERVWKKQMKTKCLPLETLKRLSLLGSSRSPTWEVPAASSRAAPHPAALVDRHSPALSFITLQRVGGQITHLQLGEVPLEICERHPSGEHERGSSGENNFLFLRTSSSFLNDDLDWNVLDRHCAVRQRLRWFNSPELTGFHGLFF